MAPTMQGATTADWITAVGTAVTALAALAALVGAWLTIRQNRKTARADHETACRQATFEYLGKLERVSSGPAFATMSSFLRGGICPPGVRPRAWARMPRETQIASSRQWWHELVDSPAEEDRALMAHICAYPNTLESLASMYNHGLLDSKIVKSEVESQAKGYLKVAEWWIEMLRETSKANYQDTLVMMKSLAEREKPSWYEEP
jgi:hypothetical protein